MIRLQFDFRLISKDNEKIHSKSGRYFLSAKFKAFEEKIKLLTALQYKQAPLTEDLKLSIIAGFMDKRHSDTQNLFKSVCDALQGIIYVNDRQIKHAECVVYEKEPRDSFIVMVEEMRKKN